MQVNLRINIYSPAFCSGSTELFRGAPLSHEGFAKFKEFMDIFDIDSAE
jgi:hypothetical protein